ncbi:MAG: hypothetical protein ACE5IQ_13420 [Candidatus Methylomirabilales bacterium]
MSPDRKKLIVLVCLVIFWIGLILVRRAPMQGRRQTPVSSMSRGASARRSGPATSSRRQAKKRAEMPRLKLSRIERVRPSFEPKVRNIFGAIEPSPAPPRSLRPTSAPTPAPPPPPDPFLEEAKKLRFLGYAEAGGTPRAFIVYGGEVLVVPKAKVFGSQFRLKAVKEDTMLVTSLDGTKEILLELGQGPGGALPSSTTLRGR